MLVRGSGDIVLLDDLVRISYASSSASTIRPAVRTLCANSFSISFWMMNGEQLESHLLRQTALVQLELRTNHDNRNVRSSRHASREGSGGSACFPFRASARERRGDADQSKLPSKPARDGHCYRREHPRLPAACVFSLRVMTSGAPIAISFFRRLFRLMMRR